MATNENHVLRSCEELFRSRGAGIGLNLVYLVVNREFKATIGFTNKLRAGFNILGRKDLFEKFTICFNDSEVMITIHEWGKR